MSQWAARSLVRAFALALVATAFVAPSVLMMFWEVGTTVSPHAAYIKLKRASGCPAARWQLVKMIFFNAAGVAIVGIAVIGVLVRLISSTLGDPVKSRVCVNGLFVRRIESKAARFRKSGGVVKDA
jgi:hypothetical protein